MIILLYLFFISTTSFSQYRLRLQLSSLPSSHNEAPVFVAGNFNNWNPADNGFIFSPVNNIWVKEIVNLPKGVYEFKFTRGDWAKVEANANGSDIENRLVKLSSDTTITYTVAAWKDDFAAVAKQHTASSHVAVMDTAFFIPQLNRTRKIWVYLPEDYHTASRRYPVLYMQDGQNVFDNYTSGFGEWGVDECLDSMIAAGKPPCIVVAVDNGPRRMNEYNPFEFENAGKGEGDQYVNFLVQTLKPFIDRQFRTLKTKEHTIIAGSSMGGLISYYAMLKFPDVFGKAGIFSPAFWTAPQIKQTTDSLASSLDGKLFFYIGEPEGETYVNDMKDIMDRIGEHSGAMVYAVIDPDGKHNEKAWRKWFDEFYTWMMADGYNSVLRLGE
jgi:predicted alpha/beta superfamily hydrolase